MRATSKPPDDWRRLLQGYALRNDKPTSYFPHTSKRPKVATSYLKGALAPTSLLKAKRPHTSYELPTTRSRRIFLLDWYQPPEPGGGCGCSQRWNRRGQGAYAAPRQCPCRSHGAARRGRTRPRGGHIRDARTVLPLWPHAPLHKIHHRRWDIRGVLCSCRPESRGTRQVSENSRRRWHYRLRRRGRLHTGFC